jgi:MYXO-CTERM domain-containing protein
MCTQYADLCPDGGSQQDAGQQQDAAPQPGQNDPGGSQPGQDAGSGATKSGGCSAAPGSRPASLFVTLVLGLALAGRRRRR